MTDYEFKLPDIGEGLSEGEIVRWHVAIGDTVKVDQDLVDIETDKAVVEIPAPVGGVVKALAGEPGDIIKVGGVLAVIEAESEAKAATPAKKKPSAAKSPEAAPALPAVAPAPSKSKGNGRAKRVLASPATRKLALERGVDTVVDEAATSVWNGTDAQYLSFNLNVMDASVAPGVTATEPGGLESREMMRIADALGRRGGPSVIEISELCPIFDVSGTTSRLAVCVVLRLMAAAAKARGEVVDQTIRRPRPA